MASDHSGSEAGTAKLRLKKELIDAIIDPPSSISYGLLSDEDAFEWQGAIIGPNDTPYAESVFMVSIRVPPEYPYEPPEVKLLTKICHPFVNEADGRLVIDILGENWRPTMTLESMLLSISSALWYPCLDDPMNESKNESDEFSREFNDLSLYEKQREKESDGFPREFNELSLSEMQVEEESVSKFDDLSLSSMQIEEENDSKFDDFR